MREFHTLVTFVGAIVLILGLVSKRLAASPFPASLVSLIRRLVPMIRGVPEARRVLTEIPR